VVLVFCDPMRGVGVLLAVGYVVVDMFVCGGDRVGHIELLCR